MSGRNGGKRFGIKGGWDIPAAVMAAALYINFLVTLALLAAAMGVVLMYPAPSIVTGALLLAGIVLHLVTRTKTCKLWRRLLLGGIAANGLIVLFLCGLIFLMLAAWS